MFAFEVFRFKIVRKLLCLLKEMRILNVYYVLCVMWWPLFKSRSFSFSLLLLLFFTFRLVCLTLSSPWESFACKSRTCALCTQPKNFNCYGNTHRLNSHAKQVRILIFKAMKKNAVRTCGSFFVVWIEMEFELEQKICCIFANSNEWINNHRW